MSGKEPNMTRVEHAERTLYLDFASLYPEPFFVGVGKELDNEIVLVMYIDMNDETAPYIPDDWEGFRVVVKELNSLIS
jgi:hypothetical protein